ncbi:MAG: ATP-dependent DNA helicase RecG [Gammaproteobacteria bacterium]|nr:MAG: ATP-dependent DNA helicase RecG [Gammaproteobacteria bacterium]
MISLDEIDVASFSGVGPSLCQTLAKLGVNTALDLVFHLPYRYEDRTRLWPIAEVRAGDLVQVQGQIVSSQVVQGKKRSLQVVIQDALGQLTLRFYHFSSGQARQLGVGHRVRCFGEVRRGRNGLEIYHPEYLVLQGDVWPPLAECLTPVYPLTEGIGQKRIRQLADAAIKLLELHPLTEWLPSQIRDRYGFPELNSALKLLHQPPLDVAVSEIVEYRHPAQTRFIFEELLAHHFSLILLRQKIQTNDAHVIERKIKSSVDHLLDHLPYRLTKAQLRVIDEVEFDMARPFPMLRLVQGDVGSGKTLVAAVAALRVIESGFQVAVMAPTEILAEQHRENFTQWYEPLGIEIGWLSGKSKGAARKAVLQAMVQGDISIVIGTHALFQDDVNFKQLALVVVDEQHRFGVHQRLALKNKSLDSGRVPHQLIMTATPIPRTLAMSAYADLDTSIIDELPPGRKQVKTAVLSNGKRDQVITRVERACKAGRQAYWVCTLVDESDALQCEAAETTYAMLQQALPELTVRLVHGRLSADEKAYAMNEFKEGRTDLLVATTVIEVGVDVPNASLMIIENPERLGLAQLHQLRGRVGRGDQESYCLLMYTPPLSKNGKARLGVMRESDNGFVIAEKDLEIRGPGEVLGTRQTGLMQFRVADLQRDKKWLEAVRQDATHFSQHPQLIKGIMDRWIGANMAFAEV